MSEELRGWKKEMDGFTTDFIENHQIDTVEKARDVMTDDRSHGDDHLAAAAEEIFSEMFGGGEVDPKSHLRTYVLRSILRADSTRDKNEDG